MFKQYLILPVQTTILKLLPLVPSIELRALRILVNITIILVIQKWLELQIDATPFWNPKKKNLLVFCVSKQA